jgi:hypothetical protein
VRSVVRSAEEELVTALSIEVRIAQRKLDLKLWIYADARGFSLREREGSTILNSDLEVHGRLENTVK